MTSAADRKREQAILNAQAKRDQGPREPFSVEGFGQAFGPLVASLLDKNSTLNVYGLVKVNNPNEKSLQQKMEEAEAKKAATDSAPTEEKAKQQRRDPRANDTSSDDEEEVGAKKAQNDDDEDDVIMSPWYDDEKRMVRIGTTFPCDGTSTRALEEFMGVVHFAALARDDPRPLPDWAQSDEEKAAEVAEGASERRQKRREISTAAQRIVAHYLTKNMMAEWSALFKGSGGGAGAGYDPRARGAPNGASPASWCPWGTSNTAEVERAAQEFLTSPWSPAPSESVLRECSNVVLSCIGNGLAVPSYSMLTRRWIPQLESSESVATSAFPSQDESTLVRIAAHCENLRWKLLRANIDGRGWTEYAKQVKNIDRRLKVLKLSRSEERRVGKECRSRWSPYH